MNNKTIKGILVITFISILIMYIVDYIVNPGYIYKSAIKIVVFLILPVVYTLYDKNIKLKYIFKIKSRRDLIYSIILGLAIYFGILTAYFLLKNFIDWDNIVGVLDKNVKVNRSNF